MDNQVEELQESDLESAVVAPADQADTGTVARRATPWDALLYLKVPVRVVAPVQHVDCPEDYPATPAEAIHRGVKFYFPGTVCKRGHIAKRYIANHGCHECKKISDNAYTARNRY